MFELRAKGEEGFSYVARVWEERKRKTFSQKTISREDNELVSIGELVMTGFFRHLTSTWMTTNGLMALVGYLKHMQMESTTGCLNDHQKREPKYGDGV